MACSDCNNNCADQCNDNLIDCTNLCTEGCPEWVNSSCVLYDGDDVVTSIINIHKGDDFTKIVQELIKNNLDVDIQATFNNAIRQLCIIKNGVVATCVTIPDQDQQYLVLTSSNKLQIWKPGPTSDTLINEVDLSGIVEEVSLVLNSNSLSITQTGELEHTAQIEFAYSQDAGNQLVMGSDGKPYVSPIASGISDVDIVAAECETITKDYSNGKITFTRVVDWDCVAAKVCPLCQESCSTPNSLIVQAI